MLYGQAPGVFERLEIVHQLELLTYELAEARAVDIVQNGWRPARPRAA